MNHDPSQLDSFETALLVQLREMVETPDATAPDQLVPPRRSARAFGGRPWYVPAAAGTAAAVALSLVTYLVWPTPAYAVSGRSNGEVVVQVRRLEGADGLERALRKHGITADVTYLPDGKVCAPGRYQAVRTPGLTLGVGSDEFQVIIPPNSVGAGDTFVLAASVVPLPNGTRSSVDFDIAHGAVMPCRVVDAP